MSLTLQTTASGFDATEVLSFNLNAELAKFPEIVGAEF